MRLWSAVAAATFVQLAPLVAWACPMCAGRAEDTIAPTIVVGIMILTPFFVAATVAFLLLRKGRDEPMSASLVPNMENDQ